MQEPDSVVPFCAREDDWKLHYNKQLTFHSDKQQLRSQMGDCHIGRHWVSPSLRLCDVLMNMYVHHLRFPQSMAMVKWIIGRYVYSVLMSPILYLLFIPIFPAP